MDCNCPRMTTKHDFNVGDTAKVRVVRDGVEAVVEGQVYNGNYVGQTYYSKRIGPYGLVTWNGLLTQDVVEVLEHTPARKPRPDEPKKIGSVVRAHRGSGTRRDFVRVDDDTPYAWYDPHARATYKWHDLQDPEVVFAR